MEKLSYLVSSLSKVEGVDAVVVFGSVARGEAGKKSDIDLLVIVDKRDAELEGRIRDETGKHERVIPVISTHEELVKEPYFLYDVLRDGIVLFKSPKAVTRLPFAMPERAMAIYSLDTSHLSQGGRVKLNQALYGARYRRKLKGGVKTYRYKGLVESLGGRMLGRGVIAIPGGAERRMDELLASHGVKYSRIHAIFVEEE